MIIHLLCIHRRISCVYTRDLLCMHNTLVHALGQGPQGPGTQKRRGPGPGTGPALFVGSLAPGVPGPQHAQEWCACTRDLLCIHKSFFCVYTISAFSYYHIIFDTPFSIHRFRTPLFIRLSVRLFHLHHDQGHDEAFSQSIFVQWFWKLFMADSHSQ